MFYKVTQSDNHPWKVTEGDNSFFCFQHSYESMDSYIYKYEEYFALFLVFL